MLTLLKSIFGGAKIDYSEIINKGASIIDVRSKGEYLGGHIKGSVNIPLNVLQNNLTKIKKNNPVITCCASGARSAVAKRMLVGAGFTEVHNGGSWTSLRKYTA